MPSERTQISMNIYESALRISPPSKRDAFVLSMGDVAVSTELSGSSKESAFNGTVADISLLLLDNGESPSGKFGNMPHTDLEFWLVCVVHQFLRRLH